MTAAVGKSFCVFGISHSKSVVTVQRAFRSKYSSHHCHVTSLTLKVRIIVAVKNIDTPMLARVWQELEYSTAVCRVTRGAHIGHLQLSKKKIFVSFRGCEQFH